MKRLRLRLWLLLLCQRQQVKNDNDIFSGKSRQLRMASSPR